MTGKSKTRVIGMMQLSNPAVNGVGTRVTIPKEVVDTMGLTVGDFLIVTQLEDGQFSLEGKKLNQLSKEELVALIRLRGLKGRPVERIDREGGT